MRGVLSSRDLQAKREFQDLAYRLLKMREEMQRVLVRMPEVQKDVVRLLESASALLNRIDSFDSPVVDTLRLCEGHLQQVVRQVGNSIEFLGQGERDPGVQAVRLLEKIINKLRESEDAINKRAFSRSAA